jgi:arginine-tRNA-protein transferase
MWRTIHWAKDNGLRYVYLGTAYKTSSLYKVRDHKGIEFFDGAGWNSDLDQLHRLCLMDEESANRDSDRFKEEWHSKANAESTKTP